jgi:hypothetical protein
VVGGAQAQTIRAGYLSSRLPHIISQPLLIVLHTEALPRTGLLIRHPEVVLTDAQEPVSRVVGAWIARSVTRSQIVGRIGTFARTRQH